LGRFSESKQSAWLSSAGGGCLLVWNSQRFSKDLRKLYVKFIDYYRVYKQAETIFNY